MVLLDLLGQRRKELQQICDDAHARDLKDGCLRVLVDSDNERIALEAAQVLERSTDAEGEIDFGIDGLARRSHLAGLFQPFGVDDGTLARHCRSHSLG